LFHEVEPRQGVEMMEERRRVVRVMDGERRRGQEERRLVSVMDEWRR
jgi:hypothetical protein